MLRITLPFLVYLLGTGLVSSLPLEWYPIGYSVVALAVFCVIVWSLAEVKLIQPSRDVALGIFVGLLGILIWIALSHLQIEKLLAPYLPALLRPSERVAYNPFAQIGNPTLAWSFVLVRVLGLVVLVPIAEELFWRGFLLRYFIDERWESLPLGTFTIKSCILVTLLFTLAHPEWLAAAIYCLLLNALLYRKKQLWPCIVAHSVSNLVLAIYVITTANWWLW